MGKYKEIQIEVSDEVYSALEQLATLSLQEPLEADGQLTLADTLPDEADMEAGCESRADAALLRALVDALPARERAIMRQRYGFDGAPKTQQQTAQALHISRSYV